MRQSVCFLLGLSLVSQVFFACKKDDEKVNPTAPTPIQTKKQPGYFVVSSMSQGSAANGRIASEQSDTEFDLGQIRVSEKFLFTIANGGDEPIFDVTLTTDNSPFEITPKTIKTVPGKNQTGIMPLLTVGVTHGKQLNGTATAPILPKGQNKATIKLSGKTISSQDTIEVTGEFSVMVEAKVFGVKFLSGGQEPTIQSDYYYMVSPSQGVKMVNTGNIKIHIQFEPSEYVPLDNGGTLYSKSVHEFDLEPNQEKDLTDMLRSTYYEKHGQQFVENAYVFINDEGVVRATPGVPNPYNPQVAMFPLINTERKPTN